MTTSSRRIVHSEKAPKAIGPYSQAVVAGGFVFCSGQIALDPGTGDGHGSGKGDGGFGMMRDDGGNDVPEGTYDSISLFAGPGGVGSSVASGPTP